MTRIKFFQEYSLQKLEEEVNDFISSKGISKVSIQTTTCSHKGFNAYSGVMEDEIWYVITVTYEEGI